MVAESPDHFYRHALAILLDARIPFLLGGAYAFACYTGIARHTKDLDIFLRQEHCEPALAALGAAGYRTEVTFSHWLAKAFSGDYVLDLIYGSGNGVCRVDDEWFAHAPDGSVLGVPVKLVPPEEMLWSKSFVMARDRFDGADIAHVLRACGPTMDWDRVLRRFQSYWHILLVHLVLFRFAYPGEREKVPNAVMNVLIDALQHETSRSAPNERVCRGTLLSPVQYHADITQWGYQDARLLPPGSMTPDEVLHWTAAFEKAAAA